MIWGECCRDEGRIRRDFKVSEIGVHDVKFSVDKKNVLLEKKRKKRREEKNSLEPGKTLEMMDHSFHR